MLLSNAEMDAASGQVRAIAMAMDRSVNELDLPHIWSGDDAERFHRDWHDLVHARLHAAANKLDGISFQEIVEIAGG